MKILKKVALGPQHKNWQARMHPKNPHVVEAFPPAVRLAIKADADTTGFFLLSISENGVTADTWHKSIADALQQAEFQYGVGIGEWEEVS